MKNQGDERHFLPLLFIPVKHIPEDLGFSTVILALVPLSHLHRTGERGTDIFLVTMITVMINDNGSYLVMVGDCGVSSSTCCSLIIDKVTASWASFVAQLVKNLPAVWETWV